MIDTVKAIELIGAMLAQEFTIASPKVTTRLARAFVATMRVENGKIKFTLPYYAKYVIEGSPPHEITVRDKKSLAVPLKDWSGKTPTKYGSGEFPMLSKDGQFVLLGKKVKHPGNPPNDFIERTLNRKLKEIVQKAISLSIIT